MKRILFLFAFLHAALTAIANPLLIDGIYYELDMTAKTAAVTRLNYSFLYKGDVVVPPYVTLDNVRYKVTSVAYGAFWACTELTSISLPEGMVEIGEKAFMNCPGLTEVVIPNTVETIGPSAFFSCANITSLVLGQRVTTIGRAAFQSSLNLKSITNLSATPQVMIANTFGVTDKSIPLYVPESSIALYQAAEGWKEFTNIRPLLNVYEIDGVCYDLHTSLHTASVVRSKSEYAGKVVIKGSITKGGQEYTVTDIEDRAFADSPDLASVSIPATVQHIGEAAFSGCTGLTYINMPNSLTRIEDGTFYGCNHLVTALLPNALTHIGVSAFDGCTHLASIVIPNSVYYIGDNAFRHCSKLTSVNLPASLTTLQQRVFSSCSSLTSVTIPASVTSIEAEAFYMCTSLASVAIPASVTTIGDYAFYECYGLTSVVIPASVKSIGTGAFEGSLIIASITSYASEPPVLGTDVFSRYLDSNLPVYVPEMSLDKYKNAAGWNKFKNFQRFIYDVYIDGIYYNLDRSAKTASVTSGGTGYTVWGELIIPESITVGGDVYKVTSIGCEAFTNSTLKKVRIPNTVTSINRYAFWDCVHLESIDIPSSVTHIGERAFMGCHNLTTVTLNGAVTFGSFPFEDCYILSAVIDLSSVPQTINTYTFYSPDKITFYVPESALDAYKAAPYWKAFPDIQPLDPRVLIDEVYYDLDLAHHTASVSWGYGSFEYRGDVTVPASIVYGGDAYAVTAVGNSAFAGSRFLHSVTLPEGLTLIDDGAFSGCNNMTSVNIPVSVKEIGQSAFQGCMGLTEIFLSDGVSRIGDRAFAGCTGLTRICNLAVKPQKITADTFEDVDKSIPLVVVNTGNASEGYGQYRQTIGWRDFTNIQSLDVRVQQGDVYYYLDLARKTASVAYAQYGLTGNVEVPASVSAANGEGEYAVTSVGSNAFLSGGITSVTLPNTVTRIDLQAFQYCTGLTQVTLPASVNFISDDAFGGCANLHRVVSMSKVPPVMERDAFSELDLATLPLYVPMASLYDYKTAEGWSDFTNIYPIEMLFDLSGDGRVSVQDATTLISVLPSVSGTTNPANQHYDLNGDGKVDAKDVEYLINCLLGQ